MILVYLIVIAGVVIGASFIARTVRLRLTPRELRGDWWSRFESEFRDYVDRSRGATPPPSGRRDTPRGGRDPPPRRRHDTPPR